MDVLTQRVDPARSGITVNPPAGPGSLLVPANVNVNSFGRLFKVQLQGDIYAQPLYISQLDFNGTEHDTVFVATMDNRVYAIDAQNGTILAQRQVDNKPPVRRNLFSGPGGDAKGYRDVVGHDPHIGILSTPVIDRAAAELYLVLFAGDEPAAMAAPAAQKASHFQHILYALDLTTLAVKRSQVISGSVTGQGVPDHPAPQGQADYQTVWLTTTNQATVTDATGIGTHNPQVHFNSMMQLQRPGLLLLSGVLYLAFGSRGDTPPYHGWVFAYRASDLARLDLICTTPSGAAGGIWQAGQGLIADEQGNVYAGSGNGTSEMPQGAFGTPNLGESFIKLKLVNNQLQILGWYNAFDDDKYLPPRDPNDNALRDNQLVKDDDLGAAAPILLPDGRIVGGGKDGYFYLIDGDQLKGDSAAAQRSSQADTVVLQYFLASYNFRAGTRQVPTFLGNGLKFLDATHHIHGAPLALPTPHGVLVYVWGENDVVRAYRYALKLPGQPFSGGFIDMGLISGVPIDTAKSTQQQPGIVSPIDGNEIARGTLVASNEDVKRGGMPGGFLSLSWDGQNASSAILWASFPSFQNGNLARVNGELAAYDATQFETQDSFSRIPVLWRSRQNPDDDYGTLAKFCCPTVADGRIFQPAGNGVLFAYGLKKLDGSSAAGGYNLARDAATPGFGGPGGLTLNGSANVGDAGSIVLTQTARNGDGGIAPAFVPTFLAGSVFGTEPIDVTNLRCRFTVKLTSLDALNMADGFTFTVQTSGPRALGSSGAGLGYAVDPSDQTNTRARIGNSLALAFNIVNNTLSLWRDGVIGNPATAFIVDFGQHGIALSRGNPLFVSLAFSDANKTLTVTVNEPGSANTTGALVINNIDLRTFLKLGTPALALIGFTGGTGAKSAQQEILNWSVP